MQRYSHILSNFLYVQKQCKDVLLIISKLHVDWFIANCDDMVILQLDNSI